MISLSRLTGILTTLAATFCFLAHLSANTITVTNTNDTGAGSLRAAVSSAVSGDEIEFNLSSCPCTITLASEIVITRKNLIIRGPGANQLTVSGNNASRVFRVDASMGTRDTISGLTIANGNSSTIGGGVYLSAGGLSLIECVLTNNTAATNGGGVLAEQGTRLNIVDSVVSNNSGNIGGGIGTTQSGLSTEVTVARSTISGNNAISGGGIYLGAPNSLVMANCRITANSATGTGGGLTNVGSATVQGGMVDTNHTSLNTSMGGGIANTGVLTLTEVTVSGNSAPAASSTGGGISNGGSLTVVRSTISGNSTAGGLAAVATGGGGINNTGTLTVTDSTISGNAVTSINGVGGGVNNGSNSTATLTSCTIAFNSTVGQAGGGVSNSGSNNTFNCRNNIIARNTSATSGPPSPNTFGTFVSQSFNLIGDATGGTGFNVLNQDQVGGSGGAAIDPLLGPLADNGGPTLTHALQVNSPALDAGSAGLGVTTDQRGFPRFTKAPVATIFGSNNSDIGAFEYGNAALRITSIARPPDGSITVRGIGLPNELYSIQDSDLPNAGSFANLAPIFSDAAGNLEYQDATAIGLTDRFYRFTLP